MAKALMAENREVSRAVAEAAAQGELRSPEDDLLCNLELPLHETFYPLGYSIQILTNNPAVLSAASECFGHMRRSGRSTSLQIRVGVVHGGASACPPEPTRREYNHLYSLVADAANQSLLDLETCANFTWLTQAAIDNIRYFRSNFLEKTVYLLLGASVVTDIHAACVGKNGKGILLCGNSGAGKTTLAYACARNGWTYTSDDTSYLVNQSESPRVIGHSHRVRFRPSAQKLFPELEGFSVTPRMEGKPSIEIQTSELPIARSASEVGVHSIVYLDRTPSGKYGLVRLPRGSASMRMGDALYSAGPIRARHIKCLSVLDHVPTYELNYRDLNDAMDALGSLISAG